VHSYIRPSVFGDHIICIFRPTHLFLVSFYFSEEDDEESKDDKESKSLCNAEKVTVADTKATDGPADISAEDDNAKVNIEANNDREVIGEKVEETDSSAEDKSEKVDELVKETSENSQVAGDNAKSLGTDNENIEDQDGVSEPVTHATGGGGESKTVSVNKTENKPTKWTIKRIKSEWRRFNLDLSPKVSKRVKQMFSNRHYQSIYCLFFWLTF